MSHIERFPFPNSFGSSPGVRADAQRMALNINHRSCKAICIAGDSDIDQVVLVRGGEKRLIDVRHPYIGCDFDDGRPLMLEPTYGWDTTKAANPVYAQKDEAGSLVLDVWYDSEPLWLPIQRAPSRRTLTMSATMLATIGATATKVYRHVTRGRSRHEIGLTATASAGTLTVVVLGVYEWIDPDAGTQKRREVTLLAPAAAASVTLDYETDGGWDAIEVTIADGGGTPSGCEIITTARDTTR